MQQNRVALGAVLVGFGVIALITVFTTRLETWLQFVIGFAGGAMFVRGLIILFSSGKGTTSEELKMEPTKSPYAEDASQYVVCPYCAEAIKAAAIKCKHCGSELIEAPLAQAMEQIGMVKHDIVIGDEVAFRTGEQVNIESVSPDPTRPEYKYVVFSRSLNKRFRLSDADVSQ